MATYPAKLIKDGNSTAVRLPKTLLTLSGLKGNVRLKAEKGRITIIDSRDPRAGWESQIKAIKDSAVYCLDDTELQDWDVTASDGIK
ncbi:AbrB/MazE/SpoVT family DNA-binding domain-containing protein [Candidatus Saccharibacteria bacterium]|nr:AbrB/MazE/SpoVT family DNA-binding domain-containing protein [Candidatus Saccharibacteria bacterium]